MMELAAEQRDWPGANGLAEDCGWHLPITGRDLPADAGQEAVSLALSQLLGFVREKMEQQGSEMAPLKWLGEAQLQASEQATETLARLNELVQHVIPENGGLQNAPSYRALMTQRISWGRMSWVRKLEMELSRLASGTKEVVAFCSVALARPRSCSLLFPVRRDNWWHLAQ